MICSKPSDMLEPDGSTDSQLKRVIQERKLVNMRDLFSLLAIAKNNRLEFRRIIPPRVKETAPRAYV